jgi:hypothetical protein
MIKRIAGICHSRNADGKLRHELHEFSRTILNQCQFVKFVSKLSFFDKKDLTNGIDWFIPCAMKVINRLSL